MCQNTKNNMMAKIKGKDTQIELKLRRALHKKGIRYRKNVKSIYGTPDIAIKKYKIAIFCDGDFWHGYDWEKRRDDIKSNRDFWINKIEHNMEKDVEVNHVLKHMGYTVIRVWEHEIEKDIDGVCQMIERKINEKKEYEVRKAGMDDLLKCLEIYSLVGESMKDTPYDIKWRLGSHPTPNEIECAIKNGELLIIRQGARIYASAFLNEHGTVNYENAKWNIHTEKAVVAHLIAVNPNFRRMGFASRLMNGLIKEAEREGYEALRLDVKEFNAPAIGLYKSLGFCVVDKYYDKEEGCTFLLLEKPLNTIESY